MSSTILVTGGAGYVGSHACLTLAQAGFAPVVYDDLSKGHAEFVQWGPLEEGDIRDAARLDAVFAAHRPVAVMHFAARMEVGESMREPELYRSINVDGSRAVVAAARRAGVDKLVFSSTCATFGDPVRLPIDENHPQKPLNPYGATKLAVERELIAVNREGFRSAILRYFNAAGADPEGRVGEWHEPETHAVPLAIEAALGGPAFRVFGLDYDTRDGTAVRDYVHVLDLADAHVAALRRLLDGGSTEAFNLGTGEGTTVVELLEAVARVCGDFEVEAEERRAGDAAVMVADAAKAERLLGWKSSRDLDEIVRSAVAWRRKSGR